MQIHINFYTAEWLCTMYSRYPLFDYIAEHAPGNPNGERVPRFSTTMCRRCLHAMISMGSLQMAERCQMMPHWATLKEMLAVVINSTDAGQADRGLAGRLASSADAATCVAALMRASYTALTDVPLAIFDEPGYDGRLRYLDELTTLDDLRSLAERCFAMPLLWEVEGAF